MPFISDSKWEFPGQLSLFRVAFCCVESSQKWAYLPCCSSLSRMLALSPPCSPQLLTYAPGLCLAVKNTRLALVLDLEWTAFHIRLGFKSCSFFYYDYLLVIVYTAFWKELHTPLSCKNIFFSFYFLAWVLKGKLWEI